MRLHAQRTLSMARLQQAFVAVAVLASVGFITLALRETQAPWRLLAFSVAALCLMPHAPILALECVWAAWVNRSQRSRTPLGTGGLTVAAASAWHWLQAWVREVGHACRVFGWQQPFASASEADVLKAGMRGVLLVHGYACNRGFWNPWMRRLRAQGVPCMAVTLEPVWADIGQLSPTLAAAYHQLLQGTGLPPVIVAHSMGGLVTRDMLSKGSLAAPPHAVVTLGTPHYGTLLASLANTEAARQMQMLSPWLHELAEREWAGSATDPPYAAFTCFWSNTDNIVFPANTATLPGARNLCIPGEPHVGLAQSPRVWDEVMALLRA